MTRQPLPKSFDKSPRARTAKDRRSATSMPKQLQQELAEQPVTQKLDLAALNIRQWLGSIQVSDAEKILKDIEKAVAPWLRLSDKMDAHVHRHAQAITLLQKKGDAEQTVNKLTKRVAPVISLKEDVDNFLSDECTRILERIETSHEKGLSRDKKADDAE